MEIFTYKETVDGNMFNLESEVAKIMNKLGVPSDTHGYIYIKEAILTVCRDTGCTQSYFKEFVCAPIAMRHNITEGSVMNAVRHAIAVAWDRGDADTIKQFFWPFVEDGSMPDPSEFIFGCAVPLMHLQG